MKVERFVMATSLGLALALVLLWLLGGGRLPVARATNITVQTTTDGISGDHTCTLREAIIAANTNVWVDSCAPGGSDDYIGLGPFTYVLTVTGAGEDAGLTGDLDITATLTIEGAGPGQTIIDAGGIDRVFDVRETTGTVVISGVTIMGGNVTGDGGGICNWAADLTLVNVEVISNNANGTGANGKGGGVYVLDGDVTLQGGKIISNAAGNDGGGIFVGDLVNLTFDGVQVISNTAGDDGGGAYITGDGTLDGVQVISNTASDNGGGAFVGGDVTLDRVQIRGNTADSGGGVYASTCDVTLNSGQIVSNTARGFGNGGGMYVNGGSATLSGGEVVSNTAYAGGGVHIRTASVVLAGAQIRGNSATVNGGGVNVAANGAFTQTGGLLVHNTAGSGGGVYVEQGCAVLSGGQIFANRANYGGGVSVVNSNASFSQVGGVIISNTASSWGGGVYVWQGSATLNGGQVISNTADDGGGLYVRDALGSLSLVNTTVSGNAAGSDGGGLYVHDGTVAITYTTVASNTAATGGGGIHWISGTVTLLDSIVASNGVTNCAGTLTSNGYNLDSGATCGFTASGDLSNTNPLLGPLTCESDPATGSGQATWVHPLLADSPAIDAALCLPGLTTMDQRGVTRPQGGGCDIGAYEQEERKIYLPLVLRNHQ